MKAQGPPPVDGPLASAISTAVVHLLAERTGEAKTTLSENGVFVVLEDNLTKGKRNPAEAGEAATVLDTRRRWQHVMRHEMSTVVEELNGRRVGGFLSDSHIDPDLAVEVFVLDGPREA